MRKLICCAVFLPETDYDVGLRKSVGGDTPANCVAQLLDFSLGAVFSLGRER
jgi:hypothetical protein